MAEHLAQHRVGSPEWYRCRRAQLLRLFSFTGTDHWTQQQLAERYGMTVGAVQIQLRKARREQRQDSAHSPTERSSTVTEHSPEPDAANDDTACVLRMLDGLAPLAQREDIRAFIAGARTAVDVLASRRLGAGSGLNGQRQTPSER